MNSRIIIYGIYYLINIFATSDIFAIIITLPIAALIFFDVSHIRKIYFSSDDVFAFIMYLFFVIEPLQQLNHGVINSEGPAKAYLFTDGELITGAAAIFLFYASYIFLSKKMRKTLPQENILFTSNRSVLIIFLIGLSAFAISLVVKGGIESVLSPRYENAANEAISVFAPISFGPFLAAVNIVACHVRLRNLHMLPLLLTLMVPLAILANPFNSSRFGLIAAYLPLILILFRGRINALVFYFTSMTFLIIVMPILNITTRFGSFEEAEQSGATFIDGDLFKLPFIDVFDMVIISIRYTSSYGYTFGEKLLGDVLFFIPRAIWTTKPTLNGLDVGAEVLSLKSYGTDNLSMPIFADAYRDFWLFGPVICGLVVSWLVNRFLKLKILKINGLPIIEFVWIASFAILLRGPLSAVITLFLSTYISLVMFSYILSKNSKTGHLPRRKSVRNSQVAIRAE